MAALAASTRAPRAASDTIRRVPTAALLPDCHTLTGAVASAPIGTPASTVAPSAAAATQCESGMAHIPAAAPA